MIDYDELDISTDLVKEFEQWIAFYEECFDEDYSKFLEGKAVQVNEMGIDLARKLKKELPYMTIYYWAENTDNGEFEVTKYLIEEN
jgi:hypothetical protein